jgi:ABC-type Fe3+-hydroxamate transport system substrate-binding protein
MRRCCLRTHRAGRLLVLLACACRGAPHGTPQGALTLTDDAGRTVRLAAPARRVVSLAPSITELVFALHAGAQVVGRTVYDIFPPAARAVPSVGDGLNPSVEAIVARHPDLVVLYRSPQTETAARQLEALGVPTLVVRDDRLEDEARLARLLGRATGHVEPGERIARHLDSLLAAPAPAAVARVVFIVWDTPPIVIGGGSYLDQLAGRAGAVNVFHDLSTPSATVSIETIATRDPDWILMVRDSLTAPLPDWIRRAEWRTVRAVRERRFLMLPAELFGQPSPRAPEAVRWLHDRLAGPAR